MSSRGESAYDVLRQVRPLHHYSARVVTAQLAGTDVSMAMRAVLELLLDGGPMTVPDLARAFFVARQGVQRIVDDAAAAGYVELRDNPAHRRSRLVAVTDAGRAFFEELHATELANLDRVAVDLDPDDLAACARVLAELSLRVRAAAGDGAEGTSVVAADSEGVCHS